MQNVTVSDVKSEQKKTSPSENPKTSKRIIHSWFPADSIVQDMVNYAYEIWWKDLVILIECENGWRNLSLQSYVTDENWNREDSRGLCQISRYFHPEIVNDNRFFTDYRFQIDNCKALRENGTPFHWPTRRLKSWPNKGQLCYKWVEYRFNF